LSPPFRNASLKFIVYDDRGRVLWQNYGKHPERGDPQNLFVFTRERMDMRPIGERFFAAPMNRPDRLKSSEVAVRPFWLSLLGWVLLAGSVGLVSCQALFNV
jgi:hypothetical protein